MKKQIYFLLILIDTHRLDSMFRMFFLGLDHLDHFTTAIFL